MTGPSPHPLTRPSFPKSITAPAYPSVSDPLEETCQLKTLKRREVEYLGSSLNSEKSFRASISPINELTGIAWGWVTVLRS